MCVNSIGEQYIMTVWISNGLTMKYCKKCSIYSEIFRSNYLACFTCKCICRQFNHNFTEIAFQCQYFLDWLELLSRVSLEYGNEFQVRKPNEFPANMDVFARYLFLHWNRNFIAKFMLMDQIRDKCKKKKELTCSSRDGPL